MASSNRFLIELKTDFFKYMTYCELCTKHNITENTLRKIIKMQDWVRKKPSKILHEIVEKKIKVSDEFLKPIKKTKKNIINDIKEDIKEEIKEENKDTIIDRVVSEIKRDIINKPKKIRKKKQEELNDDKQPIKKTCNVDVNDIKNISTLTTKIKKDCKK